MKFDYLFKSIKDKCLVLDIETSAIDPAGREISIHAQFDAYVEFADVKWFGAYSFLNDELYLLNAYTEQDKIKELLDEHEILIGFNLEEFDIPILKNNLFIDKEKKYTYVDCMQILGKSNFKNKSGYAYKNRGGLMNYSFKNNSLRVMAEEMKLTVQKGEIDYKIFQKNTWTTDETNEIKKYLTSDVVAVIDMFDKLWDFWVPFTDLLDPKFVNDLSWIKSSIASLTYKAACTLMGVEPTYADKVHDEGIEQMGGRVIMPKYEEARSVWYVDYVSLYPHIFCMFNLFAENKTSAETYGWHGNDVFKVKGYYYETEEHVLNGQVRAKLKERITLKETDPDNPMIYADKIFLNCFSDDTKIVMADNAIKLIKDCKVGEIVYSINPKTLNCEKKKIINTFEYDYNGEMHHYDGHYFDFNVTPNHRFLLQHKNDLKDIKFMESKDIESQHKIPIHKSLKNKYQKNIYILDYVNNENLLYSFRHNKLHGRTWLFKNNLEKIDKQYNCNNANFIFTYKNIKQYLNKLLKDSQLSKFLLSAKIRSCHKIPIFYNNKALSYIIGMYLAEGSLSYCKPKIYKSGNIRGHGYCVNIAQNKIANPVIYKKITDALDVCGLKYSPGKQAIKISGIVFYKFILNNFGKLGCKCFKNKEMFDVLNLQSLFEALIDGDGTKKSYRYTTKYDCLKNDFIELCMRLGYTFNIHNDGCWRIGYNNKANSFRKFNRTSYNYNGKVYCVEVEDNNTVLAGSKEKYNWTGNSLYGVARSPIFEKVHTPNCGWDCCLLGQQIQELTENMMVEMGFETIYGDTDSLMLLAKDEKHNNKEYVQECLAKVLKKINDNVPFPVDTFDIKIEKHLDYIMFPFSDQAIQDEEGKNIKSGNRLVRERMGKKKNYMYICDDKIELIGLPIKKSNATYLGIKIFEEVLKPTILETKQAKFERTFIQNTIDNYLKQDGIMELISQEYKVKPADSYKNDSGIHAQISKAYCNGGDGIINLIKNKKVGKCGKGTKYCTVQEAIDNKLTSEDLDLTKLWNEIEPFIKYEAPVIVPKIKKVKKVKVIKKEPELKEEIKDDTTEISEALCYYEE